MIPIVFSFVLFYFLHFCFLGAEYLWGFPLGQRLKDIRVKGAYLRGESAEMRRKQLDALGFNWTPKRVRKKI